MRVLIACKRGNIANRDRFGHCLCEACLQFRADQQRARGITDAKKKWLKENKDKSASYVKKWNSANQEKRREIEIAWKKANHEKVAAMNAKGGKKWAAANKANGAKRVAKRRAAKLLRTPKWVDIEAIAMIYAECERIKNSTNIPHEVDHIYPLQGKYVSGLHVHQNLQILTRSKNRSKGIDICVS